MTTFLLVRHGETADNHNQVFQGHGGGPLNEVGLAQAKRVGERLATVHLDAIYASDLTRAAETAQAIADHHSIAVAIDPLLREVDVGAWQGKRREALEAEFPEEWAAWRRGEDIRRGGGETYAEAGARAHKLAADIARPELEHVVVLVSHAGTLRALATRLVEAPLDAFAPVRNTAVSCVEWRGEGLARLAFWNDTNHLADPLSLLRPR
jgi:broad specificity phosphatase PhoE